MSALHLVYQHWFITVLLVLFGVGPLMSGCAEIIRACRGVRGASDGDAE